MKITLLRNAALILELGGTRILVDPMLRAAGTTPPIDNTPNPVRNPLVDLPMPAEGAVRGIDGCVVTHLHGDHFDQTAIDLLPRDLPILTQRASAPALRGLGFTAVTDTDGKWLGLPTTRTAGHHGTGEIGEAMGEVSGFVLDDLYIAGDTIWCDEVRDALAEHRPRVVVVNGGGARFDEGDPIVMSVSDIRAVRAATDAAIVVVHLEAMNHCLERRVEVREIKGVLVPEDGETLEL